jgi:uncharacterized membrane protein
MNHIKGTKILKRVAVTLLIAVATCAAITSYLLYKKTFSGSAFSDVAFYAAIVYIFLAVTPLYDVLSSTNHYSYTHGEYAIKGRIDVKDRVNDIMSKKDYKFSIMMLAVSGLLFLAAELAERFF